MSSFNTAQMQTDAMLAPVQMEAGRRRNEGIQYIGQAVAGAAQQFQQAQLAKQQLDIQDAEAAARISGWMQDQQVNQYKFQQLLQLDQAAQSRYGTSMMEMQAEEMKLSLDQKKAALDESKTSQVAKAHELALMTKRRFTPEGKLEVIPDKEHAEMLDTYQQMHFRQPAYSPYLEETRLQRLWEGAKERRDDAAMLDIEKKLRALRGAPTGPSGGQPSAASPNPTAGSAAGQPSQDDRRSALVQQVVRNPELAPIASAALHDDAWQKSPVWSKVGTDERTQVNMSAGIAAYGRHLLGLGKVGDPSMVHKFVMEAAETSPIVMGQLLAITSDTDEEIRMKLEVLFPGREKAVYDSYMKQVQGFMDDLLKPRK